MAASPKALFNESSLEHTQRHISTAFARVGCLSFQFPSFVPSIISDHGKSADRSIWGRILEFPKTQLHFRIYCAQASHHSPLHDLAAVQIILRRRHQSSFFPTRSTHSDLPHLLSPSQNSLSLRLTFSKLPESLQ